MEISRTDGERLFAIHPAMLGDMWADGLDAQEDELEDVQRGKLDPPTNTEGEGSIDDRNSQGRVIESEDEDDGLVERIERRGYSEAEEDLARKAGVRLPGRE